MKYGSTSRRSAVRILVCGFAFAVGCGGDDASGGGPEDTVESDVPEGDTDDDVGGDAPEPVAESCEAYCANVMAACTGDAAQYVSEAACIEWCGASIWGIGEEGDVDVPTLACHDHFAREAESNPAACRDAGPISVACGGGCQAYCEGALGLCGGDEPLYEALDSCFGYCDYVHPSRALTPGSDTLGCRLYHLGLGVLGKEPAADACAAASPEGGDVCVSKPPPNDTCATALVIETLPFKHDGDTAGAEPDYDTGAGCCLPPDADATQLDLCALDGDSIGGAQNDVVYKLTAPSTGVYTFKSDGVWPRPDLIYTAEDCANIAATCTGASTEFSETGDQLVKLTLTAGQTVYVFLDGRYGGDAGPYQFSVDPPCVPSCAGAVCGDDGCGGSCGECPEGEVCTAGACAEPPAPCPIAGPLQCGDTVTLSTEDPAATDTIGTYGCVSPLYDEEPSYDGSPELAYTLDVAVGTRVTIDQTASDYFDLLVLTDAGQGCSVPASPCAAVGFGSVSFDVSDAAPFLVIDSPFGYAGETTVTVSCCTPDCDGKVCGDDGCGGTCGECDAPSECTDEGQCECTPSCVDRVCGDDGCGGSCGTCPDGGSCDDLGLCGDKLCEGQCGAAVVDGEACQCDAGCFERGDCCADTCDACADTFVTECTCEPSCDGIDCGDDGCGGSCGECFDGEFCADFGVCIVATDSCLGACGEIAPTGACQCDSECFEYGDCCADVCVYCDSDFTAQCASCTPDCTDLECGDDGCGGSCGTCGSGQTCQEGLCGVAGDGCETAPDLLLDAPILGDLAGADANHTFDPGGLCDGVGEQAFGQERVYRFAPAVSGFYEISVAAPGFDAYLWVGEQCAALGATCAASSNEGGSGASETVLVYVDSAAPVFVVVDAPELDDVGALAFTLTAVDGPPSCVSDCTDKTCGDDGCGNPCGFCDDGLTCVTGQCQCVPSCVGKGCGGDGCGGTCGVECDGGLVCAADQSACITPGDSCLAGKIIPSVPYVDSGDTSLLGADVEPTGCGSVDPGQRDAVYELTPAVSGIYSVRFDHAFEDGHPQAIYIVSDCGGAAEACVAEATDLYNGVTLETYLLKDERVFIVVDGYFAGDEGPYTLSVDLVEAEARCEPQETLACGQTTYGALGYTTAVTGISTYGCGQTDRLGVEVAYSFVATEDGPVTFALEGLETAADLIVLEADADGTCAPTGCLGASITDESGSAEVSITATAGKTYFVVVDGPSASEQPFFAVYTECGVYVTGDGCASALEVGPLPYQATLDVSTLQDDVAVGACFGSTVGEGLGDAVLVFTPPADGVYEISLPGYTTGVGPSLIAVVPSCSAFDDGSCLGVADAVNDGSTLSVALKEGEPVAILLDAQDASELGPQTVRVAVGCSPSCGERVCGDDGCGGSCGDCDDGYICGLDGQCY